MIGMSSGGTSESTAANIPWYTDNIDGCDHYYALLTVAVDCNGHTASSNYASCKDDSNDCKTCFQNGGAAVAFMCFAWLMCCVTIYSSYMRSTSDSSTMKLLNVVLGALILLCSIIAFGAFKECANAISGNQAVGSGQALPLVAFFGVLISVIWNLFVPVGGGAVGFSAW